MEKFFLLNYSRVIGFRRQKVKIEALLFFFSSLTLTPPCSISLLPRFWICKSCFDKNIYNADFSVCKVICAEACGRHICGIRSAAEECSCGYPAPCSLHPHHGRALSAHMRASLWPLPSWLPSHLSISSICSRGRKVSIRMHLRTSLSATFLQY